MYAFYVFLMVSIFSILGINSTPSAGHSPDLKDIPVNLFLIPKSGKIGIEVFRYRYRWLKEFPMDRLYWQCETGSCTVCIRTDQNYMVINRSNILHNHPPNVPDFPSLEMKVTSPLPPSLFKGIVTTQYSVDCCDIKKSTL